MKICRLVNWMSTERSYNLTKLQVYVIQSFSVAFDLTKYQFSVAFYLTKRKFTVTFH